MPVTCSIDPRMTVAAVGIAAALFSRSTEPFGRCAIYYAPLLPFHFFLFFFDSSPFLLSIVIYFFSFVSFGFVQHTLSNDHFHLDATRWNRQIH